MTDIDNHSYGRDASPWADIRTGLTEVERRLSQLQDQLDPRQGTTTGIAGLTSSPMPFEIGQHPIGVGPEMAGLGFDPAAGAVVGAAAVGWAPSPFDTDPVAARRSAEAIVAQARAAASEVVAGAEARVGMVKEQIEQLLLARETLRKSLRTALAECESSLQRLERGEQPVHPSDERTARAMSTPGSGEHVSVAHAAAMSDALGIQTTTGRFVTNGERPLAVPEVFEGSVSLRVGPLRDISQVDTLEIALLQVPGVERVEVKEFAGKDAIAVIKLFQPVSLVEELRRVLPFQFEVSDGAADSLTLLAVEDGETGRAGTEDVLSQMGGE